MTEKAHKTSAERNAQVANIGAKLIDRVSPGAFQSVAADGAITHHELSIPEKGMIVSKKVLPNGEEVKTTWSNNWSDSLAPGSSESNQHNSVSKRSIRNDEEGEPVTAETMHISFSDEGSKGQLTDQKLSTGQTIDIGLAAEANPDRAAGILMELRGDIAAQEIAAKQAQQQQPK